MADDPAQVLRLFSNRRSARTIRFFLREHTVREKCSWRYFQRRFAELRDRLPSEGGGRRARDRSNRNLDAGSNLVFPDSIYKSYPVSLLEKNRFDQTHQVARPSHHHRPQQGRCQPATASIPGCEAWRMQRDMQVVNSSGTSGAMTFLPRTRNDYRIVSDIFGMTSRDFNEIESLPDLRNDPWHSFYLGFRGGRSHAGRAASWVIDNFPDRRIPLPSVRHGHELGCHVHGSAHSPGGGPG
jgi:hypothetical protein